MVNMKERTKGGKKRRKDGMKEGNIKDKKKEADNKC